MATVRTRALLALSVLVAFASASAAQQPTLAAAQADFAAGNHRACLQKISSVLGRPTARGGSKERYDLLMLRGECMLHLKNPSLAAEAFEAASRVTFAAEDLKPTAVAKATAILVERSPGLVFKPKSDASGEGIDILKPESRAKAMAALFDELYPVAKEHVGVATTSTDVAVMRKALEPVADAYAVELATAGESKRSLSLFKEVGTHARTFIDGELKRFGKRADELSDLAREPKDADAVSESAPQRRGLTAQERDELEKAQDQLDAMRIAAQDGRRISRRLGTTGENWDALIAESGDVRDRVRQALSVR